MSFDMASPILSSNQMASNNNNNNNNNNNTKHKNSNNTTASIRSRSSKRLTAVSVAYPIIIINYISSSNNLKCNKKIIT